MRWNKWNTKEAKITNISARNISKKKEKQAAAAKHETIRSNWSNRRIVANLKKQKTSANKQSKSSEWETRLRASFYSYTHCPTKEKIK